MRKAIVYCHDTEAGLLEESTPGRGYTFTYDKQYMMDRTHDPVSLTMPFREAPYQSDYLFPVFTNMLPEGANRKIVCRSWRRSRIMKELNHCPSTLADGFSTYSPTACKKLFDGQKVSHLLDFEIDEISKTSETMIAMRRISVSGAQEKFPAVIENGIIRISQTDERSRYILKPAPWDNTLQTRKQIPANEHLTMQIASQVYGIITAENGLCFTPHGDMIYITKRFDIAKDGSKYLMEDFASLVGKNEAEQGTYFKYDGCFEDIACAIRRYIPAWMIAMERFFKLVVFNYIYGNGDDHLKNFSIIRIGEHYQLAPAYDLMNTSLHIEGEDLGLNGGLSLTLEKSDVYERTGHPCRLDFERFGALIGLKEKRIEMILDSFSVLPDEVEHLTNNSFLTDKTKRTYLRIVKERIQRFNRKSE